MQFTDRIEGHGVLAHQLFQRMANKRLGAAQLAAFLHQMGFFCTASRPCHDLPGALRAAGYAHEAGHVQAIADSEAEHREKFAVMAVYLVNKAAGSAIIPERGELASMEDALRGQAAKLVCKPGALLPETLEASAVFDVRREHGDAAVARAVGVGLAIEVLAHRSIVPGEVLAFVESGFYGVTLDDPSLGYLKEHAGEEGAEAWHAEFMERVCAGPLCRSSREVYAGIDLMCDKMQAWYDALQELTGA